MKEVTYLVRNKDVPFRDASARDSGASMYTAEFGDKVRD